MLSKVRALILDGDIWTLRIMKGLLAECFPGIEVETRLDPDPSGSFNLYFIGHNFEDNGDSVEMVAGVVRDNPHALVIALCEEIDPDHRGRLRQAGCNAILKTNWPKDLINVMEITRNFVLSSQTVARSEPDRSDMMSAIRSVTELLRLWNRQLEHEAL